MVSVGSLPVDGKQVFDLETQSGVMQVLASIRASDIDTSHKSELRDLVFLYTNGGRDQSVRIALEQKLTSYQIVPVAPKQKVQPQKEQLPQPTIGKFRFVPSFSVHVAPVTESALVTPPATDFTKAPAWKHEPVREGVSAEVVNEAVAQVPVEPVAQPAPVPEVQPEVSPVPAPEAAIPVATTAHPVEDKQYLDRIREIKAAVNEKVGNPVNLVDINNEVGREYMGAILDAMKKLNSGTSAASAMKRLEEAYAAVLKTLETRESRVASVAPQAPAPAPYVPPAVKEEPEPVRVEPVGTPYVSVPPVIPEPQYNIASNFETGHEEEHVLPQTPRTGRLSVQSAVAQTAEPVSVFKTPAPVESPAQPQTAWVPPPTPPPTHAVSTPAYIPLSDLPDKPLSIDDLPTTKETLKSAIEAGDPLFTAEVDEGLNQLLSEWSIFKKSGIFGTGPKGKEHPLFKKMAPLNIPLLLAGRFEGATQEIKQSVTDYMNGWRYEQGLIYQQGETFEHYLRRVIRHILDLQQ